MESSRNPALPGLRSVWDGGGGPGPRNHNALDSWLFKTKMGFEMETLANRDRDENFISCLAAKLALHHPLALALPPFSLVSQRRCCSSGSARDLSIVLWASRRGHAAAQTLSGAHSKMLPRGRTSQVPAWVFKPILPAPGGKHHLPGFWIFSKLR